MICMSLTRPPKFAVFLSNTPTDMPEDLLAVAPAHALLLLLHLATVRIFASAMYEAVASFNMTH